MNYPKTYEEYCKLDTPELAEIMAGREEIGSKANIARIIYEERQMKQQHEYTIEQMDLQHKNNIEITSKQVKWIKFSAILTAIATLAAAIAGSILTYIMTH